MVRALRPLNPRLRVAEPGGEIPFVFDERTISLGANFTLVTDAGDVDLLAHVEGFRNYREIRSLSQSMTLGDHEVQVLSLEGLIRAKRAANRPKDRLVLPELEVLLEAEKRGNSEPL